MTIQTKLYLRAENGLVQIECDLRHWARLIRITYTATHARVVFAAVSPTLCAAGGQRGGENCGQTLAAQQRGTVS